MAEMNPALWSRVDRYFVDMLVGEDDALQRALDESTRAGLPAINVAPNQGKLLHLLARMQGARRILEVGTLGGYSTIWLARALPHDGSLVTLEIDPAHAAVARRNLAHAGVADRVEVIEGAALDTLPALARRHAAPFDFAFVDADKQHNADYFDWAVRLSRPGAVIVVDNVARAGAVVEVDSPDASVQGVRRLMSMLERDARVQATAVQTVGSKGYDGFVLARVVDAS